MGSIDFTRRINDRLKVVRSEHEKLKEWAELVVSHVQKLVDWPGSILRHYSSVEFAKHPPGQYFQFAYAYINWDLRGGIYIGLGSPEQYRDVIYIGKDELELTAAGAEAAARRIAWHLVSCLGA